MKSMGTYSVSACQRSNPARTTSLSPRQVHSWGTSRHWLMTGPEPTPWINGCLMHQARDATDFKMARTTRTDNDSEPRADRTST